MNWNNNNKREYNKRKADWVFNPRSSKLIEDKCVNCVTIKRYCFLWGWMLNFDEKLLLDLWRLFGLFPGWGGVSVDWSCGYSCLMFITFSKSWVRCLLALVDKFSFFKVSARNFSTSIKEKKISKLKTIFIKRNNWRGKQKKKKQPQNHYTQEKIN